MVDSKNIKIMEELAYCLANNEMKEETILIY
jgi:hypothetical protein